MQPAADVSTHLQSFDFKRLLDFEARKGYRKLRTRVESMRHPASTRLSWSISPMSIWLMNLRFCKPARTRIDDWQGIMYGSPPAIALLFGAFEQSLGPAREPA